MIWFNKFFGQESSLKNAIDVEENKKDENKVKKEEKEKNLHEKRQEHIGSDYVVLTTVRLISMLSVAQECFPKQLKTRNDVISFLNRVYIPDEKISMEEVEMNK